jgi:hypothetical protein
MRVVTATSGRKIQLLRRDMLRRWQMQRRQQEEADRT